MQCFLLHFQLQLSRAASPVLSESEHTCLNQTFTKHMKEKKRSLVPVITNISNNTACLTWELTEAFPPEGGGIMEEISAIKKVQNQQVLELQ